MDKDNVHVIWSNYDLKSKPRVFLNRDNGGLVFGYIPWRHVSGGRCGFSLFCEVGEIYKPDFDDFFRSHTLDTEPVKTSEAPFVWDRLRATHSRTDES